MLWPNRLSHLLRNLWRGEQAERQLEEELQAHLDMLADEKIQEGMEPEAARRAARLEMEGVEQVKESVRGVRAGRVLEEFGQDVRYGLRLLKRNPGFALVVMLTLALGIGGTAAIFSFVHGVLLRPLAYPEPDNLVLVCEVNRDHPSDWCGGSPGNLWDWQRESRTLESIGLARSWPFSLKAEGRFEGVAGGVATDGLFQTLRVQPTLGRLFERADHDPGRDHVVLLSHRLWQERFGADPAIVGRTINLDEEIYSIVGVLPAGFEVPYLEWVELWIPLWSDRVEWRFWRGLRPFGRLAPGHTLQEARAEMQTIAARLAAQYPDTNTDWGIAVDRVHDRMVAPVRPALFVFLGAVGFVLLIACANTANLMLARATAREREFAVRLALGAGRMRLVRFLLTESLLLALGGGLFGVLLARWAVDLFVGLAPSSFPRLEQVTVDAPVLAFSLLLALGTTVLFGLFPAWQSSRLQLRSALQERGPGNASERSRRAQNFLVVAELALALILLTGAGLLLRTFVNLTRWQPGFDTNHLVLFSVFPPLGKYQEGSQLTTLYRQINQELTALPGVLSVGEVSAGPLSGGGDGVEEFHIEGRPLPANGEFPVVAWFDCGPDYFRTLGVPLERGRFFTYADTRGTPPVALINQTMARRFWPEGDPIGARVRMKEQEITLEIVGVVRDVPPFDPREAVVPEIYWPLQQFPRGATFYAVRTATDPAGTIPSLRARLEEIEPEMAVASLATLDQRIARQLVRPRFHLLLLGIFSAIACVIAMVGVYGVVSYAVAARTHEIGIRMALGARRGDVFRWVLSKAMGLVLPGVGVGALGALSVTHLLRSLLVQVTPTDITTFAAVTVLLVVVALVACYLPARRATRVDPMVALRYE